MRPSPLAAVLATVGIVTACGTSGGQPPARELTIAAYVAPWDNAGPSAGPSADPSPPVDELSPVWYQPTEQGTVKFASAAAEAQAARLAGRETGRQVDLVPSVSNFRDGRWDGELVATILADPSLRRRHLESLVALAARPGIAGVDLDYESLAGVPPATYTAFVRDLADALHRAERRLSVTVHAKTDAGDDWPGARAQDWKGLGSAADEIRVMAYDHSWPQSPPGPVAPLPWVDDVLRLAVRQIPPHKVFLGVPTYGYDWPESGTGQDLDWAEVRTLQESRGARERWHEESASPWFTYVDERGARHTVWYENARSLQAKLALARRHGVGGVSIWKIGGEDPAIWSHFR